jgi:Flp pilus assembly protein TadG
MAQIVASKVDSSERGAALLELALVLPLLLVVIAGIVDFGFALQRFEVIANGAREGARLAAESGYDAAAVEARVRGYVQQGLALNSADLNNVMPAGVAVGVTNPTLTITLSGGASAAVPCTRVDVFYHHQFMLMRPVLGLINKNWGQSITLHASSVMRPLGGS